VLVETFKIFLNPARSINRFEKRGIATSFFMCNLEAILLLTYLLTLAVPLNADPVFSHSTICLRTWNYIYGILVTWGSERFSFSFFLHVLWWVTATRLIRGQHTQALHIELH